MIKKQKIKVQQRIVAEIDYDKLAEAIVKVSEKQNNQYSVSREWMKFIIHPVFWTVAIIAGLLSLAFFVYGGVELAVQLNTLYSADWQKIIVGFLAVCIGFFLMAICLFTSFTAKEINEETDRQYIATMFANVVALVALVVSLIALVKG